MSHPAPSAAQQPPAQPYRPYPVAPAARPGHQPVQPYQQYVGYPAPQPGQQVYQQPVPELQCRLCGSVPAVKATFRGHQGMLIIMRFLKVAGPFCRSCGLAVFRDMSAKTLVQGWYGYFSFIATPVTVLINLITSRKVRALAAPRPAPYGPSRPPMDPGDRLLMRPMAVIGLAIPFLLVFAVIALASVSGD